MYELFLHAVVYNDCPNRAWCEFLMTSLYFWLVTIFVLMLEGGLPACVCIGYRFHMAPRHGSASTQIIKFPWKRKITFRNHTPSVWEVERDRKRLWWKKKINLLKTSLRRVLITMSSVLLLLAYLGLAASQLNPEVCPDQQSATVSYKLWSAVGSWTSGVSFIEMSPIWLVLYAMF